MMKMIYLDLATSNENEARQPFLEYKPERARVVVLESEEPKLIGSSYKMEDTLTIGRNEHNDIIVNDGYTSHEHACITKIKKGYWLYDLNSTNGTLLNGKPISKEEPLKDGDLIKIGTVTLKFER
jgi:pSer/pThr/pTyr-binding forkhead associated (FHA) protein